MARIPVDGTDSMKRAISAIPNGFLEAAKRSTDPDLTLENYIAFVLLSADRAGIPYQQAMGAIREKDSDLKPEAANQIGCLLNSSSRSG